MSLGARLRGAAVVVAVALAATPTRARACGWDWETYHAEARSLPCVFDAILGFWPKHSDAYHQRRIAAVDQALRWMPGWTEGLDARGISALKLGRMDEARAAMERRQSAAPGAYAGHANLGTLFTFTGEFEAALRHIDAAMAIEPQAHFGREKYHRDLVVFLRRIAADPEAARRENFLGITLTPAQRSGGSPQLYRRLGLADDAIDALVAMITVYGADAVPEIYLALGEALAARGHKRLAYSAYRRARELGHPRKKELGRWMSDLASAIEGERLPVARPGRPGRDFAGGYRGIGELYVRTRREGTAAQKKYMAWEEEAIAGGLAIWTAAGVDAVYAKIHASRRRCQAPRVIGDPVGGVHPDVPDVPDVPDAADAADAADAGDQAAPEEAAANPPTPGEEAPR